MSRNIKIEMQMQLHVEQNPGQNVKPRGTVLSKEHIGIKVELTQPKESGAGWSGAT